MKRSFFSTDSPDLGFVNNVEIDSIAAGAVALAEDALLDDVGWAVQREWVLVDGRWSR